MRRSTDAPLAVPDADTAEVKEPFDEKADSGGAKELEHRSSSILPLPVLANQNGTPSPRPKMARFRNNPLAHPYHDAESKLSWRQRIKRLVTRFTHASTGTPSDGINAAEGGSESSASVSRFLATQRELAEERLLEESDAWTTDEVVVKGQPAGLAAAAWRATGGTQTGTGTETNGIVSSAGSVHAGSTGSIGLTKRILHPGRHDNALWHLLRYRIWPYVGDFFWPRFESAEKEEEFRKMQWYTHKRQTALFSVYLVINWALYLIGNHSETTFQKIYYYGPLSLFTVGLPPMVYFDMPNRSLGAKWFFQIWFTIACFLCGYGETIEWHVCGFYSLGHEDDLLCAGKDFLALLYYATALPALALFTAGDRLAILIGQIAELVFLFVFLIPTHTTFARNVVNYIIFSLFVDWLSYSQEIAARHSFMLNSSLKHAYRAQQKLQQAESAAQNSKRKLTSYIFHEVRVPLNTALLAFQNLQANSAFREDRLDSDSTEIHALEGSLQMMGQVLNDVLDMQRLDSGKFESNYIPFPLHRAINSLLGTIRVATTAKRLEFVGDMDPRIDGLVSQLPAYAEHGLKNLWVVGDELRLRQVISNLASNAVKFTPEGKGRITVRTQLLAPLQEQNGGSPVPPDAVVFRFEVQDGGPGIKPSDLANARLFTPFHQTVASRLSTTKGSGLGLALVKQIITLSGGRLGVKSAKGQGATLWFELGLRIATPDEVEQERDVTQHGPLATPAEIPGHESRLAQDILQAATHSTAPPTRPTSELLIERSSDAALSTLSSSQASATSDVVTPASIDSSRPLLLSHNTASPSAALKLSIPPPTFMTPRARPLKVLVVDDDKLTRTLMTRMLSRLGCEVETADDGQAFLDRLLGNGNAPPQYFDVVTLDNHMEPGISGEEAIRRLREAGRTDLVCGCTGNALRDDTDSFIAAGASRVLTKPIMQKDIKQLISEAEAQRSAREESDDDAIAVVNKV